MKKQRSGPSSGYYFPDDCWELIFRKLREDDERDLDSISLVSKRFLSISNRVKLSLNVHDKILPLLPNLVRRFGHIETIVIDSSYKKVQDIDGLVDQISRSGVLNLRAMKFPWWSTKLPRDGFKALALNKNTKNNLKDEVPGHVTDDGVDALASKLKELKEIVFEDFYGPLGLTSFTCYTLTKSCPLLENLKMTNTGGQEMDLFVPDYLHQNHHMRHLDISRNMWLTDTTLENFGQVCPNLQFLDVSSCMRPTNSGIREILRRCPAIRQLNIHGLNISDVFGSYSDHCVVNLKTLEAQETQIDDKGMAMIGKRCRNLQYLDSRCCKKVTDKGVMEVVRNCARLRKVSSNILPQMAFSRPSPLGTLIHQVATVSVKRS
ncbi:hypothetical protein RHSIM_Rhsim01G0032900 [Rhododendron simsii]|uniref:F-box/LRR-repeat protein 15-like leucin rich repeat domain-containing protein n=1 Tax=Rhododendron simsii TaxID=118357 RepID=A0A834HPV3_RHOSS|nr:hypothetical protein RHSIM_Rhsim01G0032900 [Rhododendron simsii]